MTSALRAAATRAVAEGHVGRALEATSTLFARDPSAAAFVVRTLGSARDAMPWARSVRLHVLRTYTFEPVALPLRAESALHGVFLDVAVDDFGVVDAALLDRASRVYAEGADLVLLATRLEDLCPELRGAPLGRSTQDCVAEAVARFDGWLRAFRAHSTRALLVQGPERLGREAPPRDALRAALADAWLRVAAAHADVFVVDLDGPLARLGPERALDPARATSVGMPYGGAFVPMIAHELARTLVPLSGRAAKVLVTDLDDTLWGGILGEDGASSLELGDTGRGADHLAVQRVLLGLASRGMMLAVASKNDDTLARAVLEGDPRMLLRTGDFAALRIHYGPKADSLVSIARELNVGVDTLLFVDDSPVERAAVREQLPMVHVVALPPESDGFAEAIATHPAASAPRATEEDRNRPALVTAERERAALLSSLPNVEDFLQSLELRISATPVDARAEPAVLARAAQLTQKTNQFNTTTRRRTESELLALANGGMSITAFRVRDRFGDNGLVGLSCHRVDGTTAELDTLLMSCRVLGRTVEHAMLALVRADLSARGVTWLEADFVPTERNGPARDVFERLGFDVIPTEGAPRVGARYRIRVSALPSVPPWFIVEPVAERCA